MCTRTATVVRLDRREAVLAREGAVPRGAHGASGGACDGACGRRRASRTRRGLSRAALRGPSGRSTFAVPDVLLPEPGLQMSLPGPPSIVSLPGARRVGRRRLAPPVTVLFPFPALMSSLRLPPDSITSLSRVPRSSRCRAVDRRADQSGSVSSPSVVSRVLRCAVPFIESLSRCPYRARAAIFPPVVDQACNRCRPLRRLLVAPDPFAFMTRCPSPPFASRDRVVGSVGDHGRFVAVAGRRSCRCPPRPCVDLDVSVTLAVTILLRPARPLVVDHVSARHRGRRRGCR